MTLKTWKEEFYPKKPTKRMTKNEAIEHSLTKWTGLLKDNLKKHEIKKTEYWVEDNKYNALDINVDSCALCKKYCIEDFNYVKNECENCPLYKVNGNKSCGDGSKNAPYTIWLQTENPKPMIKLLEKTLKIAKKEETLT